MARLFHWMAAQPAVFMILWPALCIGIIVFGWTRPGDPIEDQVAAQWVPTRGTYAQDKAYAAEVLDGATFGSTVLAAMAIARDGENLYTEDRLNELLERMQMTENVTVEYKNMTFTWEDMCMTNGGYPYELPCARITSMDYFQEARWYFDSEDELYRRTWYQELIRKLMLDPILPRFGIMTNACAERCQDIIDFRMNGGGNPLRLLADVRGLDLTNDCRICIEDEYDKSIPTTFQAITEQFTTLAEKLTTSSDSEESVMLVSNLRKIADNLTTQDVKDFLYYYTARKVYEDLGSNVLLDLYSDPNVKSFLGFCKDFSFIVEQLGLFCPPLEFSDDEAKQAMLNHADAEFSSVNTGGVPLPFWGSADGIGGLFEGSSPIGGSGVDMSAALNSLETYLSTHETVNLTSVDWEEQVEKNPFFAWFMAEEEMAPPETKCGNQPLPGTNINGNEANEVLLTAFEAIPIPNPFEEGEQISVREIDNITAQVVDQYSRQSCTPYSIPNDQNPGISSQYSRQHFARMWYDLLILDILGIKEGEDDPYTWTIGVGCGYDVGQPRGFYTAQNESAILKTASKDLYFFDEGTVLGVVSPEMLVGDANPPVGEYSFENPLQKAGVLQTLYPALAPSLIIDRVRHCKRPGGPVEVTQEDASEILYLWKEAAEKVWNDGWDDETSSDVQFVSFTDDAGVIGSTGRMLREITLSNTTLTVISIFLIAIFSVLFMFSFDVVESRVFITLIGVSLVVLAFFAAVAMGLSVGIKIQVTIAWTLPFIILGLGVDDMYIVLQALKEQDGYSESDYLKAMKEVVVPVTMTSIVNASMFAILNLSDIPAVYTSARVALFAVIGLYVTIILCFPAYCYVDMQRQAKGKRDLLACGCGKEQGEGPRSKNEKHDFRSVLLYDNFFRPIILGESKSRRITHALVWLIGICLFGGGIYGITESTVGVGLEEFFPASNPGNVWATTRTEGLASWNVGMRWGALNYTEPRTQMRMIKQFESVVASSRIATHDTDKMWMGNFLKWTSRLCGKNFDREDFDTRLCGHDMVSPSGQRCTATWAPNTEDIRDEYVPDFRDSTCVNFYGGICRKGSQLHPADVLELTSFDPNQSYCPTIDGWTDEQWQFCLMEWRKSTGFDAGFALKNKTGTPKECSGEFDNDQELVWPIVISESPLLFAFDMQTHEDTLELIEDTREFCDDYDNEDIHCWMYGIPYDYWSQYESIYEALFTSGGMAIAVGSIISFAFLFLMLWFERNMSIGKVFCGALIGACLILAPMFFSFVAVVGLSSLAGVNLTGFSNMSYVLSVGFSVEYAVHIVSRWLLANQSMTSSLDRVKHTMSFLMLPTFMSFVSSVIGVCCLAFTAFSFNEKFFFRPLIIVMFVTYFYGCWWLPTFLCVIEGDIVRVGPTSSKPETYAITSTLSVDSSVADYPVGDKSGGDSEIVKRVTLPGGAVSERFEL